MLLVAALPLPLAAPPAWWSQRGVLNGGPAEDYAAANIGQLKNIAAQAAAELEANLPGGAGLEIDALIASWRAAPAADVTRNDFAAVNLGQLKAVAKPFYDRLAQFSYAGQPLAAGQRFPWTSAVSDDDDFASANLGQLKHVFSFAIPDSDGDGLSDLFETTVYFTDPNHLDSDRDGIPDGWEVAAYLDPNYAGDATDQAADASGFTNRQLFEQSAPPGTLAPPEAGTADPLKDWATIHYAAIDVSSEKTTQQIGTVAIDDENDVAFGYYNADWSSFHTSVFKDGAPGEDKVFPVRNTREVTVWYRQTDGTPRSYITHPEYFSIFLGMNAEGYVAGFNAYRPGAVYEYNRAMVNAGVESEFWPKSPPDYWDLGFTADGTENGSTYAEGNLGNNGLFLAAFQNEWIGKLGFASRGGSETWYGWDTGSGPGPGETFSWIYGRSPEGVIGTNYGLPDTLYTPAEFALWTGTSPTPIGPLQPYAVSDSGLVFGRNTTIASTAHSAAVRTSVNTTYLHRLIPPRYRNTVQIYAGYDSFINNRGDVLCTAGVLDKSANPPVWRYKPVLWTNVLGLSSEPSALSFVEFPANTTLKQFNNEGVFAGTMLAQIINPQTGLQTGTRRVAAAVLPVEFTTSDITKGFDYPLPNDPPPPVSVWDQNNGIQDEKNPQWWTSVGQGYLLGYGLSTRTHVNADVGSDPAADHFGIRIKPEDTSLIELAPTQLSGKETALTIRGKQMLEAIPKPWT